MRSVYAGQSCLELSISGKLVRNAASFLPLQRLARSCSAALNCGNPLARPRDQSGSSVVRPWEYTARDSASWRHSLSLAWLFPGRPPPFYNLWY